MPSHPDPGHRAARSGAWWLAAALLGSACSTPPPASSPPPAPPVPAPVETRQPVVAAPTAPPPAPVEPRDARHAALDAALGRLLDYQARLQTLSANDLARESVRLEVLRSGVDPRSDEAAALAIEQAVVLAHARLLPGDTQRAAMLVEPLAREESPAHWQAIARLLLFRFAEQRRLEEQLERQAQQLREQQRRVEQLGAQIEALRAIERSLSRQAAPAAARP
jgi:hypothetical protein